MPESPQREFALEVVERLRAAGFEALWAGGCVRDQLLGIAPKDYDVATNAKPEEIRAVFGVKRTLAIGAAFGVITVLGRRPQGQIEVATFRTDAEYSDGRRPDAVHFTTAEHDAERRDFTINGLFYDPVEGQVVDYVGGRADLERRIIRAIGDPQLRLTEDKLRMLRAVRFAATFDFAIEPATQAVIQAMASEVTTVSAERIGMELRRMLTGHNPARAFDLLLDTGLLAAVLPEVARLDAASLSETRHVLTPLETPTLPLALAALLHRGGEPGLANPVCRRLRYTNHEAHRVGWLLANLPTIRQAPDVFWPSLQRILVHDGGCELVTLLAHVDGDDSHALAFVRERLAWQPERLNPPPLVDGTDLIGHGLAPSPDFARLLDAVRDAQLMGEIETQLGAMTLVQRILDGNAPAAESPPDANSP
jgi:tRNA nucleotidyltransferase/poly(A) polymerase